MEHEKFAENYRKTMKEAFYFSNKARREGLLQLEDMLDTERESNRDIFMLGLRFIVDGTDTQIIDKILSNIINQEKDELSKLHKTIQKEAILAIQEGLNPYLMYQLLASYTDIPGSYEEFDKQSELYEQERTVGSA
jgi:flagellar motor component MotA